MLFEFEKANESTGNNKHHNVDNMVGHFMSGLTISVS
jgi:hypothetical protein